MKILQFFLRYTYAPLFFLAFTGIALQLIAVDFHPLWLVCLLLPAILISFIAERIEPFEEIWNHPKNDLKRDVLHAIANEGLNIIAIAAIPVLAALTYGFDIWPREWTLWLQLALAVFVADFGITLAHYASHKFTSLWKLHAVHHSVTRMYGFNGLMKHPLHLVIELTAGTTPLLFMGMPIEIGALLGFTVAIQLMLQHSNVDMRLGWLVYLWAVAPGHRHHHLASKTEGDVNFGLFSMLWDHLLRTFVRDRPQPREGELGIAGREYFPQDYFSQLIEPFRSPDNQNGLHNGD